MKKYINLSVIPTISLIMILSAAACSNPEGGSSGTQPRPGITLTSIAAMDSDIEALIQGDMNNIPVLKELEKRTGVRVDRIVTTAEEFDVRLSLLISSGEAPDIFPLPSNYPGGPAKAAADGIIIRINEYWDKFAPNYKRVVTSNPEWEKSIKADNGDVYTFAFIREDKSISVFFGPMVRKDLLDKAGLPMPETLDEWHTMLTAFKGQGIQSPFTALNWFNGYSGAFTGAFGVSQELAVGTDGKIHYGPIEPGYREYLQTFSQWYKEGLIDPDYVTMKDWRILDAKIISGSSAATLHFLSSIVNYTVSGKQTSPEFQMAAAKYPVLRKGDKPLYGQCDPPSKPLACVNAKSRYIEEAVKYLDYGYSPEGQLLFNFGLEDESYTLDEKGNPRYTGLITTVGRNEKGWSQEQALAMYSPASSQAPTVQMKEYFDQVRRVNPYQKEAVSLWADTLIPSILPNLAFTNEDLAAIRKYPNIGAFVEEMTAKFIIGAEPMENYDMFVQNCKNMGIESVLEVYNKALSRYNKR